MPHSRRVAPAVVFVAAAVFALGACAPTSAGPSPASSSPTPLTDEEAFAAAEETYRAYVDALNARRAKDASADPQQFLDGSALEDETETEQQLEAAGVFLSGTTSVLWVKPKSYAPLALLACIDMSETRVLDAAGNDVTPTSRPDRSVLELGFAGSGQKILTSAASSEPC